MKSIELFKPRTSLMGKFSYKDMPNYRIQLANDMMFCEHNEMHEIQEAVMTFKPHVRYNVPNYLFKLQFSYFFVTLSYICDVADNSVNFFDCSQKSFVLFFIFQVQ